MRCRQELRVLSSKFALVHVWLQFNLLDKSSFCVGRGVWLHKFGSLCLLGRSSCDAFLSGIVARFADRNSRTLGTDTQREADCREAPQTSLASMLRPSGFSVRWTYCPGVDGSCCVCAADAGLWVLPSEIFLLPPVAEVGRRRWLGEDMLLRRPSEGC